MGQRRLVSTNDGCTVAFRFDDDRTTLDHEHVTVRRFRPHKLNETPEPKPLTRRT
jgi:hypothetical protein